MGQLHKILLAFKRSKLVFHIILHPVVYLCIAEYFFAQYLLVSYTGRGVGMRPN